MPNARVVVETRFETLPRSRCLFQLMLPAVRCLKRLPHRMFRRCRYKKAALANTLLSGAHAYLTPLIFRMRDITVTFIVHRGMMTQLKPYMTRLRRYRMDSPHCFAEEMRGVHRYRSPALSYNNDENCCRSGSSA